MASRALLGGKSSANLTAARGRAAQAAHGELCSWRAARGKAAQASHAELCSWRALLVESCSWKSCSWRGLLRLLVESSCLPHPSMCQSTFGFSLLCFEHISYRPVCLCVFSPKKYFFLHLWCTHNAYAYAHCAYAHFWWFIFESMVSICNPGQSCQLSLLFSEHSTDNISLQCLNSCQQCNFKY